MVMKWLDLAHINVVWLVSLKVVAQSCMVAITSFCEAFGTKVVHTAVNLRAFTIDYHYFL